MLVRRRLVAVLLVALVVVPFVMTHGGIQGRTETCARPATALRVGDTIACVHADAAPPGIDVTERPSTAELRDRAGAGRAAVQAAADLGVPTSTRAAAAASGPAVSCDGDGTSGFRVQPMYVVEANKTNRYSSLLGSFRVWAAGVDDVVNRSAALTGGVRHLRYVTVDGAGSSCVAKVLNVTVPAGSLADFGTTVHAVQALGYNDPARKYLMWTDAQVMCGVATMYTSDGPGQDNANNGAYAQYARVDSGCWGLGDGSGEHSVEAHELMHTLGGVQNTAPHSTKVGHCWDESDTMCYADGGSHPMKQVCAANREYFYDCNHDDYFSTLPQAGTYIATHWNAADSRFLIGGGDGTHGGTSGVPTALGATVAVNNPAVPGLATQVSVAPQVPRGRTLTKVAWTSKRSDCAFSAPTAVQSEVTCAASASGATTVTVTLTDSSGASRAFSSALKFSAGSSRPVALELRAAGQSSVRSTTASVCTGAPFGLDAVVVDVTSGSPIKGLAVTFQKKTSGLLGSLGNVVSSVLGVAGLTPSVTSTTPFSASSAAGAVYAAGTSKTLSAVPGKCSITLTGSADKTSIYSGEPITITGRATRTVRGAIIAVTGLDVPVKQVVSGSGTSVTTLVTPRTGADGSYSVQVWPQASGAMTVTVPGSPAYAARTVALGTAQVKPSATTLDSALNKHDSGYGSTVVISGHLNRIAGALTTGLRGTLEVLLTPADGPAVTVGTVSSSASGAYAVAVPITRAGSLSVTYAGADGQPGASAEAGAVTVGTWVTRVSSAASSMRLVRGSPTVVGTVSGTLSKTYGGLTQAARGLRLSLLLTPAGTSSKSLLGVVVTTAGGAFSAPLTRHSPGIVALLLAGVPGYAAPSGGPFAPG